MLCILAGKTGQLFVSIGGFGWLVSRDDRLLRGQLGWECKETVIIFHECKAEERFVQVYEAELTDEIRWGSG